jgi:cytohesin
MIKKVLLAHEAVVDARITAQPNPHRLTSGAYDLVGNFLDELGSLTDMTPLHLAAFWGHADAITALLAGGANAKAKDSFGRAPLHLVAFHNPTAPAAKQLLAHRAQIGAKDKEGQTPLHVAAHRGNATLARFLLAEKAEVDAKDNSGATPLHFAVIGRHAALIELLLAHGVDVNARDNGGDTALRFAIRGAQPDRLSGRFDSGAEQIDIVKLLREHGARE